MSDTLVVICWKTAEYLAVLCGQNNWGNKKRRGEAAADLAQAMGKGKMETSLGCFDLNDDTSSAATKAVLAERKMILSYLRAQPNTESLVAGIESGECYKFLQTHKKKG